MCRVFAWVEDTAESPGDYYRPLQLFSLEGMERMEGMVDSERNDRGGGEQN